MHLFLSQSFPFQGAEQVSRSCNFVSAFSTILILFPFIFSSSYPVSLSCFARPLPCVLCMWHKHCCFHIAAFGAFSFPFPLGMLLFPLSFPLPLFGKVPLNIFSIHVPIYLLNQFLSKDIVRRPNNVAHSSSWIFQDLKSITHKIKVCG